MCYNFFEPDIFAISKNNFLKKDAKMTNWVFCIKIAKNGLKIEEKCQKMSKKIIFLF